MRCDLEEVAMCLLIHLPLHIAENYNRMIAENSLNEREKTFFTDTDDKLIKFWEKAGEWLELQDDRIIEAGEYFIGVFLTPLKLCGTAGDGNNPSPKKNTVARQRKADKLIGDAYTLADELVSVLIELEKTSPYLQYESNLLPVARRLIPPLKDIELASYYEAIRTHKAISILKDSLKNHPKTDDMFKGIAGMYSNKSSAIDWYREAKKNLASMLEMFPNGRFTLTQAEWSLLSSVLVEGSPLVFRGKSDYAD